MTLEELIEKSKAMVSLRVNDHRNIYRKSEDYIKELRGRDSGGIDDELARRMIETDTIYELLFYPHTPIGFYLVYGASLEEVLQKAESCFE